MVLSQKQAVYQAVIGVLAERETPYETGTAVDLSTDEKKAVIEILVEGFFDDKISLTEQAQNKYLKQDDDKALRRYTDGLVNNWLRKDKRLNGGVKHEIKNPGSRAGSGDSQLRELKKLKKLMESEGNTEAAEDVEEAIQMRIAEIAADKIDINSELIPEALRKYLPTTEEE